MNTSEIFDFNFKIGITNFQFDWCVEHISWAVKYVFIVY